MYTTAHAKIRQQSFETFWYTHHLFIPFLLAMYTHATGMFRERFSLSCTVRFAGERFWKHCLGYEGLEMGARYAGGLYLCERVYTGRSGLERQTEIIKVVTTSVW